MTETWKPIPGLDNYEASDRGRLRSLDSVDNIGRLHKGRVLAQFTTNRGYQIATVAGKKRTVHTLVLMAHRGLRPPGMVARHLNDDALDNRLENLTWGTAAENERDKFRNGTRKPAAPKPVRHCVGCGVVLKTNGRRCHACGVQLGVDAADAMRAGETLENVAARLDYPAVHLHKLAVQHGGYGQSRLRRTLRRWLKRGDRP